MKHRGRKCFAGFLATALGYISLSGISAPPQPLSSGVKQKRMRIWVATGNSWADRQACRWIGACGTFHLKQSAWTWDGSEEVQPPQTPDTSNFWTSGPEGSGFVVGGRKNSERDTAVRLRLCSVCTSVLWRAILALRSCRTPRAYITPTSNYTKVLDIEHELNLTNLDELNEYEGSVHGRFMYLQSGR